MICQLVTDEKGNVIAVAFEDQTRLEEKENEFKRSGVLLEDNQKLIELDVPDDYPLLSTRTLMQRLEADLKAQT